MTLLERIAANTECQVDGCHEARVEGALFCAVNDHLTDFWRLRLTKTDTGWMAGPEWRRRDLARDNTAALLGRAA